MGACISRITGMMGKIILMSGQLVSTQENGNDWLHDDSLRFYHSI